MRANMHHYRRLIVSFHKMSTKRLLNGSLSMHTACFFSIIIYYYSPLPIYNTMEYIREYKYYSGEKLDKIDGM